MSTKKNWPDYIFTLIFPFIGFPWDVDWAFSPYIISHQALTFHNFRQGKKEGKIIFDFSLLLQSLSENLMERLGGLMLHNFLSQETFQTIDHHFSVFFLPRKFVTWCVTLVLTWWRRMLMIQSINDKIALQLILRITGIPNHQKDGETEVWLWFISQSAMDHFYSYSCLQRICIPSSYNRNGCTIYPPYPYYYYPQLKGLYDVVRLLLSEWQMKMLCVFLIRYHHSFFFTEFGLTVLYGGDFTHTQTWQYFAHWGRLG